MSWGPDATLIGALGVLYPEDMLRHASGVRTLVSDVWAVRHAGVVMHDCPLFFSSVPTLNRHGVSAEHLSLGLVDRRYRAGCHSTCAGPHSSAAMARDAEAASVLRLVKSVASRKRELHSRDRA